MFLKDVEIILEVSGYKSFTRTSGRTGQELLVSSGSQYPARVSCPDKEVVDLSTLKSGDLITCIVSLGFASYQCISDNDIKYYKRVPTFTLKELV